MDKSTKGEAIARLVFAQTTVDRIFKKSWGVGDTLKRNAHLYPPQWHAGLRRKRSRVQHPPPRRCAWTRGGAYFSDPRSHAGTAHFLEHMLFMGTQKYKDVDAYMNFVATHGGGTNAYTTSDHTCYFFDIHNELEEAVDRFAQFFINPLLLGEYVEKEKRQVHSEHEKNLMSDPRRVARVQSVVFSRKDHPSNKFATGNLESLKACDRKVLRKFFNEHYCPSRMHLCILSMDPLDDAVALAHKFAAIPRRSLSSSAHTLQLAVDRPIGAQKSARILLVQSLKDIRTLEISFILKSFRRDVRSKPDELAAIIIGDEGDGSLLQYLMSKQLAMELSVGNHRECSDYQWLSIVVHLTPSGLEAWREVVAACFSYLQVLRESTAAEHRRIFKEVKAIAHYNEAFQYRGEGMDRASKIANQISEYGLAYADIAEFAFGAHDEPRFQSLLRQLSARNATFTLVSNRPIERASTESIYGTQYRILDDAALNAVLRAPPRIDGLHLPQENSYVSRALIAPTRPPQRRQRVRPFSRDGGIDAYVGTDHEFFKPLVSIIGKLRLPQDDVTPTIAIQLDILTTHIMDALRGITHPASLANLMFRMWNERGTLLILVGGYSPRAAVFLKDVVRAIRRLRLEKEPFERAKDAQARRHQNYELLEAHAQARARADRSLHTLALPPSESLRIVQATTLDALRSLHKRVFKRAHVQLLVYGDVTPSRSKAFVDTIASDLVTTPIAREQCGESEYRKPSKYFISEKIYVNNSCLYVEYATGEDLPLNRAKCMLLMCLIAQPFFDEFRTERNLGYLVRTGTIVRGSEGARQKCLYFIIQSPTHSARAMYGLVLPYIKALSKFVKSRPAHTFTNCVASAIKEIEESPRNITQRAHELWGLTFDYTKEYDRDEKTVKALRMLGQSDIAKFIQDVVRDDASITVQLERKEPP